MYWGDFFSQFPPLYDKYYDPSSTNIKYKPRIVDKKIIETEKNKNIPKASNKTSKQNKKKKQIKNDNGPKRKCCEENL